MWIAAALLMMTAAVVCAQAEEEKNPAEESPRQDIWQDDSPRLHKDVWQGPGFERRYENLLIRIEEENPKRAMELKKLRDEDPEKFQLEMQKEWSQRGRPAPEGQEREMSGPMAPGRQGPGPEGPQPPDKRFAGPGRWQEQLQKRHEEFLQWLEKNYPEQAFELAQIREKDAASYVARLMGLRRKYEPILHAEKNNPELAAVLREDMALQNQRDDLLKQIRRAKGDKREKMVQQLEKIVAQRFDLIIRKKTLQYQELEQRLKRSRKKCRNDRKKSKNSRPARIRPYTIE